MSAGLAVVFRLPLSGVISLPAFFNSFTTSLESLFLFVSNALSEFNSFFLVTFSSIAFETLSSDPALISAGASPRKDAAGFEDIAEPESFCGIT